MESMRESEMVRNYESGKTLQQVADIAGVTRQRASQIMRSKGFRGRNRRGATSLAEPGHVVPIRIPEKLRKQAEEWGRSNGLNSFSAVVRVALNKLVDDNSEGDKPSVKQSTMGWECPKCASTYSPSVQECRRCCK